MGRGDICSVIVFLYILSAVTIVAVGMRLIAVGIIVTGILTVATGIQNLVSVNISSRAGRFIMLVISVLLDIGVAFGSLLVGIVVIILDIVPTIYVMSCAGTGVHNEE